MSLFKNTYFSLLRQQHRFLYKLCCCLVLAYLILNIVRIELPPVFLSMMYSVPIQNNDTQYVYDFRYNDDMQWNAHSYIEHHKRIMFYYTIDFYNQSISSEEIQAADGIKFKEKARNYPALTQYAEKVYAQKTDIESYPQWLKKYMESIIKDSINSYVVTRNMVAWSGDSLNLIHVDTVINYNHE